MEIKIKLLPGGKMRWRMDKQAKSELYLPNLWKEISRKAKQTCKNEAVGVLLARM